MDINYGKSFKFDKLTTKIIISQLSDSTKQDRYSLSQNIHDKFDDKYRANISKLLVEMAKVHKSQTTT